MSNPVTTPSANLLVDVQDIKRSFRRTYVPDGPDPVIGKFSFILDITAPTEDIYIPVSIASGKKPTGFVYQIEGTVPGLISTTAISCEGDGIAQITLGTIVYAKIPKGLTSTFRIRVEMRGKVGKSYTVAIRQINYKRNPSDTRYQKSLQEIRAKMLKFA
ncbi:MAG: hypothetical protein AB199_01645 [Parcubacteria bacterium C7867-004]|nr:MAG: hypothetical protein AB199_01645 [Parcubacteria bacterium C7867-004]